jgi:uncharacterized nucleotidyltransferase DUF6036
MDDPISIILELARVLDHLEVKYWIGGSIASSVQGISRATNDIDLVIVISTQQIQPLFNALKDSFYVDDLVMRRAVSTKTSFNALHLESLFKVDFYVAKSKGFDAEQLRRRQPVNIRLESAQSVFLSSPEDTILSKLRWYRKGGEKSDRQWSDVIGVIKVQGKTLNSDYLNQWADELGVGDLLARAFSEVGS